MKTRKISLQFFIVLFSSFTIHYLSAQGPTSVPAGNVSGTWIKANSPYQIEGDITIDSGDTLTIEPGVTIEFQGYYKLTINGEIFAVGAENDTILFTVNDPSDFDTYLDSTAGSWNGIEFYNNKDSSVFDCCKFQYGKAFDLDPDEYHDDEGGVFYTHTFVDKLVIIRCCFYYNYAESGGGALGTRDSDFLVEKCRFTYNRAGSFGGAIFGSGGQKHKVYRNYFAHNQSNNGGAICFLGGSEFDIAENVLIYNTASYGGAIYIQAATFKLTNNIITNNHSANFGGAIYCNSTSYSVIAGNLIVNNTSDGFGGGLYLKTTDPRLINNTICKNTANKGGGIYTDMSNPEIHNSIIHGNEPEQIYIEADLTSPDIYYSDLQDSIGGIAGSTFNGIYENNISLNPLFEFPSPAAGYTTDGYSADWSLQPSSSCINKGNPDTYQLDLPEKDIYGNPRVKNNIIDIGAAETHISVIEITGDITSDQYWFSDTVKILSDVTVTDGVTLKINAGTVVEFQDYYKMTIKGVLLAEGSENNLITFTVPEDKYTTGWAGLEFDNSNGVMYDNDSSLIDYCRIEYAKKYDGGGIYANFFSYLTISNSVFMHDSASYRGSAIYVDHCSPLIKSNIISYNYSYLGTITSDFGSPAIIGNTITYNTNTSCGGIHSYLSSFIVRDNYITNNEGGFYASHSNTKEYVFINNVIANNEKYGISAHGINLYFLNNTIVNNNIGIATHKANLTLINDIIWGNGKNNVNDTYNPDENPIKILNCNIKGGLSSIIDPSAPNLEYDHIIDQEPSFVNPTDSIGWTYESVPEDWQLLAVSPSINSGLLDDFPYALPSTDFLGQNRINGSSIDMGAIENQDGLATITEQPANKIVCAGDSINLNIVTPDTAYIQWQKDGIDIPNATIPVLVFDSVTIDDEGNYQCIISNAYGQVKSDQVYVMVRKAPEILTEPTSQWLAKDKSYTLRIYVDGSSPLSYQWKKDGIDIPGAVTPEYKITDPDYTHEGDYTCRISNACGEAVTSPATLYLAPQICMVTVDPLTGNNLVVWEKNSIAPISCYNIYRESKYAGIYDLLTVVPHDQLSIYNDTTADPTSRAYLYKITAVDTSGYETDMDLCKTHKTIHLLVTKNPETKATQLDWDRYVGFDYGTYEIFRSDTTINFLSVDAMSSSTSTWSDPDPGTGTKYYRVAALRPEPCYPTGAAGKKAESGPYSHSMSNIEDNRLQTGMSEPLLSNENLMIYPNPFNESTSITFSNTERYSYTLYLKDLTGKVVKTIDGITGENIELNRDGLPAGLYLIELRGPEIYRGKIIIE